MAIFELTADSITVIPQVSFADVRIRERGDLQRLIRANIAAIDSDLYVIAEEYGAWEDARRSIDLLCIDKAANLVVVELKRTDDGGHMELQALRYAAMVSRMTLEHAIDAHKKYLRDEGDDRDAAEAIMAFLDWEELQAQDFAQKVRIVLVSADFSKEITTTVMWLTTEYDLDIRCVRVRPYSLDGRIIVDIQPILPLPEVDEYQVQFRKKAAERREAHERSLDWSRYDFHFDGTVVPDLTKRKIMFTAIRAFVTGGTPVSEVIPFFAPRKFVRIPGSLDSEQFRRGMAELRAPGGGTLDPRRFFLEDGELLRSSGETVAISNQWSIKNLPQLDELLSAFPQYRASYSKRENLSEGD